MKLVILFLNLPITIVGILMMFLSLPYGFKVSKNPLALIVQVKNFWWAFGYMRKARAMTIGYIILLGPDELKNDLEHEIIHVKQAERYPLIFPVLYYYELFKSGYRKNKFEDEAYSLSKSVYKSKHD